MSGSSESSGGENFLGHALDVAIRIGVVVLLAAWCFAIVRPFIMPVVWGIVIAVAAYPAYGWLLSLLGGRRVVAAVAFTIAALLLLITPAVMLSAALVDNAQQLASHLGDEALEIPPPPQKVSTWPIVGEPIYRFWSLANENLEEALSKVEPQIAAFSRWLLAAAADAGLAIVQFVLAIVFAGVLMTRSETGAGVAHAIGRRLAGEQGQAFAELSGAMVRSVARGILGVAIIQSGLAGLGFLAAGVPAAGILALLCLILAVIQVGPLLVLIPAVIWVFSTASTVTAVLFLVWCVVVGFCDNVLKPMLLGRGVDVPMPVIFIGAIGGFLSMGIIGLFVGAVVLAVGYSLFSTWLEQGGGQASAVAP